MLAEIVAMRMMEATFRRSQRQRKKGRGFTKRFASYCALFCPFLIILSAPQRT